MNFTELAVMSQSGDTDALEQLMFQSYTPVYYLSRKLLQNDNAAKTITREVMQILANKLNTLQEPELFEKWLLRITSARCMQALPQVHRSAAEADEDQSALMTFLGRELNEEESIRAIDQMVSNLPDDPRICILLYCCGGLHSKSIAQIAGYSQEDVRRHLANGQMLLQEQLEEAQRAGTQFSGITSLTDILYCAMYRNKDDQAAMPIVYGILGKPMPVSPDPLKWVIRFLGILLALLLIGNLIAGGILILKMTGRSLSAPKTAAASMSSIEAIALTTEELALPETTLPIVQALSVQAETTAPTVDTVTGADGHTHKYPDPTTVFNCETGGTNEYLCSICGFSYIEELPPTGSHTITTLTAKEAGTGAGCTTPGKNYKACTKCDYSLLVDDPVGRPPLGHNYATSVKLSTATEQGYTTFTCTRCGDSYKDKFVDPPAWSVPTTAPTEAP